MFHSDHAPQIMTWVGKPVWDHLLHQHTDCYPNKEEKKKEKKKKNSLCSQFFAFCSSFGLPNYQVLLYSARTMYRTSITVQSFHITETFLCPFLSRSRSAGIKTVYNSQWRPGGESNASLQCIFLSLTFFPSMKKKQTLYYFNKLLVLIHYWSPGWSTGHCITRILKPIMAWHSCTREKL